MPEALSAVPSPRVSAPVFGATAAKLRRSDSDCAADGAPPAATRDRAVRGAMTSLVWALVFAAPLSLSAPLSVAQEAPAQPEAPQEDASPLDDGLMDALRSAVQDHLGDDEAAAEEEEPEKTPEEALADAFDALRSDDEQIWRDAENEISRLWSRSGSPSYDLLLRRSRDALEEEEWDKALDHLNDLVNLAPEFAEGWNMRATLHFQQENFGRSLADIAETLAREPRHFGALSGLGVIMESIGREDEAMAAYRAALALHPNLENAQAAVDRLAPTVDGRDI